MTSRGCAFRYGATGRMTSINPNVHLRASFALLSQFDRSRASCRLGGRGPLGTFETVAIIGQYVARG